MPLSMHPDANGPLRMSRLFRRLRSALGLAPAEDVFDVYTQERMGRQAFYFNAFKALRFNGIKGDYAEFGSWGGLTFGQAYHESRRVGHTAKLWAFDSFRGLPPGRSGKDEHPEWVEGKLATTVEQFHENCATSGIPREAYTVVPGFFDETLATMPPDAEPGDIALAYVDCDLHSSTLTVLRFLEPRLKHGMIVAFDDYFCWSPSQLSGERAAMLEVLAESDLWGLLPFMRIGWHGQSFIVEDKALY